MLDAYCTSGGSPPIRLTLTHVSLVPGSTIAHGRGTAEDGAEVSFAGDWRPLAHLADLLAAGETVQVHIFEHQILTWRRP